MLRIRKLTDYAFVVLVDIRRFEMEQARSAQAIAESTSLPLPTVSKVLQQLSRGGLIESKRGFCGGYSLARSAEEITAVAVVEAMEGPLALTECSDPGDTSCAERERCAMHGHWPTINAAVKSALAQVTLDALARDFSKQGAGELIVGVR